MEVKIPQAVSPKLTPTDLRNKEFKRALWGYSARDVVEYLELTAKGLEKWQRQEKEMGEKIQSLNEEILRWKGREGELAKHREKALVEAEEIKNQAAEEANRIFKEVEERANSIRQKTEEWLENVIAQVEETERQKSSFVNAFRIALESHYEILKKDQENEEPLGSRLNQFLKSTLSSEGLNH